MVVEMKPFPLIKRILIWLGLCSVDENTKKWEKIGYISFSFMIGIILSGLTASLLYFWQFLTSYEEMSLLPLFQITGNVSMLYSIITVFLSRQKISALFRNLSEIYDERKLHFFLFNLSG